MKRVVVWLKHNGLSLSMLTLFAGFLFADSATGLRSYNSEQVLHGFAQVSYWRYLGTGAFLDGVFVNWQAAILQLAALIVFSEFLIQRGASHSRKPEEEATYRRHPDRRRSRRASTGRKPARRQALWLYRNSLSFAFILLFLAAFALHVVYGFKADNEQRALLHRPPTDVGHYLVSSRLWTDTFQCWQAEFFAMWFFLVASIYLRQERSPESKATDAASEDTGDPNE